jgi:hypothetical protein
MAPGPLSILCEFGVRLVEELLRNQRRNRRHQHPGLLSGQF